MMLGILAVVGLMLLCGMVSVTAESKVFPIVSSPNSTNVMVTLTKNMESEAIENVTFQFHVCNNEKANVTGKISNPSEFSTNTTDSNQYDNGTKCYILVASGRITKLANVTIQICTNKSVNAIVEVSTTQSVMVEIQEVTTAFGECPIIPTPPTTTPSRSSPPSITTPSSAQSSVVTLTYTHLIAIMLTMVMAL